MVVLSKILQSVHHFKIKRLGKKILKNWGIELVHPLTIDDAAILKEIFCDRIYADFFPFYQDSTIIDIGAHKGLFSLFAFLNTGPRSKIIALEPSEKNYQLLTKNIQKNNATKTISTVKKGIAGKSGRYDLQIIDDKNHSIYESYIKILGKEVCNVEHIEALSISDLILQFKIEQIDFMKMDCEGAEFAALLNLKDEVLKKIKTLSLEFHDLKDKNYNISNLASFLLDHNYAIMRCDFLPTVLNINTGQLVAIREN